MKQPSFKDPKHTTLSLQKWKHSDFEEETTLIPSSVVQSTGHFHTPQKTISSSAPSSKLTKQPQSTSSFFYSSSSDDYLDALTLREYLSQSFETLPSKTGIKMPKIQTPKEKPKPNLYLGSRIEDYHRKIQSKKEESGSLFELGKLYLKKNDKLTAISFFKKAIAVEPKVFYFCILGNSLLHNKSFTEATKVFGKIKDSISKLVPSRGVSLKIYEVNFNEFDDASLEISKTYADTADSSKVARKMSGERPERTTVRESARIPKFDEASLELSKVYWVKTMLMYSIQQNISIINYLDRYDIEGDNEAAKIKQTTYLNLGDACSIYTDYDFSMSEMFRNAVKFYSKVNTTETFYKIIKLDPKNTYGETGVAFYNLGQSTKNGPDPYKAINFFKRSIELSPEIVDAYIAIAQIYQDEEDFTRVSEYYKTATKYFPKLYKILSDFFSQNEVSKKLLQRSEKDLLEKTSLDSTEVILSKNYHPTVSSCQELVDIIFDFYTGEQNYSETCSMLQETIELLGKI